VPGLGLARLDEHGALDDTFGDAGVVYDNPAGAGGWRVNAIRAWNGKLVVAGTRLFAPDLRQHGSYVLARYSADDGELDRTFDPDGPYPGHVLASVGSDDYSSATGLAVDPHTGTATVTGFARDGGAFKLLLDSYASDGSRDPEFRSYTGNGGPRLVAAGDGTSTLGSDIVLDSRGGMIVTGAAHDGDWLDLLLTRYGAPPPTPNRRPIARIRGHHIVPRKHWVRFVGLRSSDPDGRIVDYAWRTGTKPYRSLGPVFWHRFGRTGLHVVNLRVTDDDGARSYAKLFVRVRKRTAAQG
jgi:hypothetical protein